MMNRPSYHNHLDGHAGLGLTIDLSRRSPLETSKGSCSSSDEGKNSMLDQLETPRSVPKETFSTQKSPRQISRRDSVDLDSALQYISPTSLNQESQGQHGRNNNVRRRGRAIYLNDLLQYNQKSQAKKFHSTLIQWRDGQGGGGEMGEEVDEDVIILLAQARSLAQSSTHMGVDSPSPGSSEWKRNTRQRTRPQIDLETSASTPEGALGKSTLPNVAIDFSIVNWNRLNADYIDDDDDDDEERRYHCQNTRQVDEVDVLRAGLRFAIGCYDELVKKGRRHYEDVSDMPLRRGYRKQQQQQMDGDNLLLTPRSQTRRSRSRSIIKTLAKKGTSLTTDRNNNRLSYQLTPAGQESVLDFDTSTLDQVSGPSSRYGMANVTPIISPSVEEKSHLDQTSFTPKGLRRRSDSFSLSSPLWTRRLSRIETPSEELESSGDTMSVSHNNFASALQKMKRTEISRNQSVSNLEEMLRKERVTRAALERELETIKASFESNYHQQQQQLYTDSKLSDIEKGARSEEEQSMMAAVAQAARDTAEAEERQAEWKSQCEHLEERVNVVENALYQAMGLLAGKGNHQEEGDMMQTNRQSDEDISESGSPFYSAGEEEEEKEEAAAADSSHDSSASFGKTMLEYSKKKKNTSPPPKQGMDKLELHRDSMSKVSGSMVEESPLPSDDEGEHEEQIPPTISTEPVPSKEEAVESRRGSHASWTRHSILPPQPPLPTSPLPNLPKQKQDSKENPVPIQQPTSKDDNLVLSSPAVLVIPAEERDASQLVDSIAEKEGRTQVKEMIDYSSRRRKRNDVISKEAKIESLPTLSVDKVLAASSPGNATLSAPFKFMEQDDVHSLPQSSVFQDEQGYPDEIRERTISSFTNSSIKRNSSISRSRSNSSITHYRRASTSDSMRSGTSQPTSIGSSSNATKEKMGAKKNSKLSILGHMPPTLSLHNSISQEPSRSSSTNLSPSISSHDDTSTSSIAEHYQRLGRGATISTQIPNKATQFARRTRF